MDFGIAGGAAITVIVYIIGLLVKASPLADKWIPIICGLTGGVLGIVGMFLMPEFPANDFISATAVGIVSGLASTGADKVFKQAKKEE